MSEIKLIHAMLIWEVNDFIFRPCHASLGNSKLRAYGHWVRNNYAVYLALRGLTPKRSKLT